jgi:hypothetical protein
VSRSNNAVVILASPNTLAHSEKFRLVVITTLVLSYSLDMNHCSMGPAADQFDLLGPLVKWVEQGVAPQAVVASVRGAGNAGGVNTELPSDWSAKRTRPLCAYPTVATYKGSGSVEDASNFSCR